MTSPSKRLAPRLALALVAGLAALAAGEALVRWLLPAAPPLRLEQFSRDLEQRHHIRFEEAFRSDPELLWRLAPSVRLPDDGWPLFGVVSNGQGLREDHEIAPSKGPAELRVLFLGDSCTFGYLVPQSATFVEQVEDRLSTDFPGVSFECINAGVPGYSLFQGWRLLVTEGSRYRPDLVVVSFGWNDAATWDGRSDADYHAALQASAPPGLLARSRLCGMLWAAGHRGAVAGAGSTSRPRLLPYEFRSLLERVDAEAHRLGADLLLFVAGGRSSVEHPRLRDYRTPLQTAQYEYGRRIRLGPDDAPAYVDGVAVVQSLARDHAVSDIFFDDVHTTARTHHAIAEAIVSRIRPWVAEKIAQRGIAPAAAGGRG